MSHERIISPADPTAVRRPRRLPVIAQDDCTGCGRCVAVCPSKCLEMVWDFATLVRIEDCNGCGLCDRACPHDVIRMTTR